MVYLTEDQLDALKEIVNIGIGHAAHSLNEMLESHIELVVPSIFHCKSEDLEKQNIWHPNRELSCVKLNFQGKFSGTAGLAFPPESAIRLVSALTGEEPGTNGMDSVMAGTLNEVGNIIINGVIGSLSNTLAEPLDFSLPVHIEGNIKDLYSPPDPALKMMIILLYTYFKVEDLNIDGNIFLIFELGSFTNLLSAIDTLCFTYRG